MEIYLHQNGERSGPYTLQNLQSWLEAGQLTVADAAWFEGCSDWVTVQDVPGIMLPGGDHLVNVSTVPPFEAYQGDEPYVFISYSHKDAAVVYEEITRLHEAGINVWYDEGIEASNEWPEEIARAVVDCTVFLAFVSPRATASVNCRNEINLALNENKPFLGIYLEETELPLGLRLRMGDLQAILRYKLPVDRYQKKTQDSLDQLLGKKPVRSRTRPTIAQQTEAVHEPEPVEQSVQTDTTTTVSKPRRKGLAVALASLLLIACGALGYLFLGDDGDTNSVRNSKIDYRNLDDYFFSLEKDLKEQGLPDSELIDVKSVLGNRYKFPQSAGLHRDKLLIRGTSDDLEKISKGQFGFNLPESRDEYEGLNQIMQENELLNLWSYRLVECTPVKTKKAGAYSTIKKPINTHLLSYGTVVEKKSQKKFDDGGKPIANPATTITQTGTFYHKGKREVREFRTTYFSGGIKGHMVEVVELSAESRFLRTNYDNNLNHSTKRIEISLIELLQIVIAEETINPLFKACLHLQIVELIKRKPLVWGVVSSGQLLTDYENLVSKSSGMLPNDWMDASSKEQMHTSLMEYYVQLTEVDYLSESRLILNLLLQLQEVEFKLIGSVDAAGIVRFYGEKPDVFWGLRKADNLPLVQGNKNTRTSFHPFSPLISTNPRLAEILARSYAKLKAEPGCFGSVDEIFPLDFLKN